MSVCPSVCHVWRGDGGEGGQEGEGQWGGGISQMKCQGGHTFPEQRWITQLVYDTWDMWDMWEQHI